MKTYKFSYFVSGLLILLFSGCEQATFTHADTLKGIMKEVDRLIVFSYTPADTRKHVITATDKINLITSLIDGKVDHTIKQCNPTGHILFYKGNKMVFECFFSVTQAKGEECAQLSYLLSRQRYNTRLTYRAGMFLSDLYR